MSTSDSFAAPLAVSVRNDQPGVVVLALRGSASMDQLPTLEQHLEALQTSEANHVVLDLAELAFINSPAIGSIVAALHRARARGGSLRIARANQNIDRMFRLTHIDLVIPLHPTVEAALSALRPA